MAEIDPRNWKYYQYDPNRTAEYLRTRSNPHHHVWDINTVQDGDAEFINGFVCECGAILTMTEVLERLNNSDG